jgi:hypothetical protein
MRTIQIGIEVHKAIEAQRLALDESENAILMRLLGLKPSGEPQLAAVAGKRLRAWVKDQVELPHGTELRVFYSGQEVHGRIEDGQWVVGGKTYSSPSMALIDNVRTKNGARTNLNGWNHWEVKLPGQTAYRRLMSMR